MKRVLFVDDEPQVLRALERSLYQERARWTMVFVRSAWDALFALARAPFDVVVSDLRMPHMDGMALLERVRSEYPSVTRILLSGSFAHDATADAAPLAHRVLAKPCRSDMLLGAIVHARR